MYQYFAYLLGCSQYGMTTSPYAGSTNMYQVHKYMALDNAEVGYFIEQVGMAAASFGVSESDVQTVGKALMDAFGYKCEPPMAIPKSAQPELQSICIADDCPLSPNATCSSYAAVVQPKSANGTMGSAMPSGGSGSGSSGSMPSGSASGSGSMPSSSTTPYTGAAGKVGASFAAAAFGVAAYFL